jgi:hypothetical protein
VVVDLVLREARQPSRDSIDVVLRPPFRSTFAT